jgi:hypothetical protein
MHGMFLMQHVSYSASNGRPDADRHTRLPSHTRRPHVGIPISDANPSARDVLFDPARVAVPCITALRMLRSTIATVSAPAICPFRGSITYPAQQLCTLRVRHCCRLTQHSLPGGLLDLTWAGLHQLTFWLTKQAAWGLYYCRSGAGNISLGVMPALVRVIHVLD